MTQELKGGEGMSLASAYQPYEPNQKSVNLAEKITALIIDSAVTYQEADDALVETQKILKNNTKPIRSEMLH